MKLHINVNNQSDGSVAVTTCSLATSMATNKAQRFHAPNAKDKALIYISGLEHAWAAAGNTSPDDISHNEYDE